MKKAYSLISLCAGLLMSLLVQAVPELALSQSSSSLSPASSSSQASANATSKMPFVIPKENRDKGDVKAIKGFEQRAATILAAIVADDPAQAKELFFPGEAFAQLKDIKNNMDYYKKLIAWYEADIHREHQRIKDKGELKFKALTMGRCQWKDKGSEANKIPYWSCYRGKFTASNGKEDVSFDLRAIINWGDQWYVTHLGPIPKQ